MKLSQSEVKNLIDTLNELRPLLLKAPSGKGYLPVFDEFMREQELGLALHAVCDAMLESDASPLNSAMLEKIRTLHETMNIQDQCISDLSRKLRVSA